MVDRDPGSAQWTRASQVQLPASRVVPRFPWRNQSKSHQFASKTPKHIVGMQGQASLEIHPTSLVTNPLAPTLTGNQ